MEKNEKNKCPLCGKDCKIGNTPADYNMINCENIGRVLIDESVKAFDDKELQKRYNVIYRFLITHKKINSNYYRFFYDETYIKKYNDEPSYINVADLLKDYPKSFSEKIDFILLNLYNIFTQIGMIICENKLSKRILYCESNEDYEKSSIIDFLEEFNYLKIIRTGLSTTHVRFNEYAIGSEGWKRIDTLKSKEKEIKQGFIAMSFKEDTRGISDCFKTAIVECGYVPKRMDEKEHNNQIVPEILFEIERSEFIVVDVTIENLGAYYEAGYAQALGKQVIVCCSKWAFDNNAPHFDISQKNMIIWSNEKELVDRPKKRIEATIGLNL